jgi:hypothetical protein
MWIKPLVQHSVVALLSPYFTFVRLNFHFHFLLIEVNLIVFDLIEIQRNADKIYELGRSYTVIAFCLLRLLLFRSYLQVYLSSAIFTTKRLLNDPKYSTKDIQLKVCSHSTLSLFFGSNWIELDWGN